MFANRKSLKNMMKMTKVDDEMITDGLDFWFLSMYDIYGLMIQGTVFNLLLPTILNENRVQFDIIFSFCF